MVILGRRIITGTVLVLTTGCGGDSSPVGPTTPTTPSSFTYQLTVASGANQTARVGSVPTDGITVRLMRSDNTAVSGATLSLSAATGGGSVSSTSVVTSSQGIATIPSWTLGSSPGSNTLTVASTAHSASTTVTATARWPLWTVMVYLAADNNLAAQGFSDIEEMEAAGYDPEVQVVIQAEFSPHEMSRYGVTPALLGLDSWDTFRYVIGDDTRVPDRIDGSVTYGGSVDMTDPAELTEFVQWAQNTYPSERSILVPWNHGGGWIGLIEDATDGGGSYMSLSDFKSALLPLPKLDIIDFDMCNMAGYSTLAQLQGQADFAVFSQETVPGTGLPYTEILDAIQDSPTSSSEEVAAYLAARYMVTTAAENPEASITKSAYSLSGFSALDTAIGALGTLLQTRLPSWGPGLQMVGESSQHYTIEPLKDLVSFTTVLKANTTDAAVIAAADDVISAATSTSFRIAYLWNNGSATLLESANDVSDSQGLNIVFPSGVGEDNVDTQGSRSVSEFTDAMPTSAWSAFLVDWANLITPHPIVDQGQGNALQIYEVWDTVSFNAGADVDFWLVEPDGNVSVPYLGTVTSNGNFTPDSRDMNTYYEGWNSRRIVQSGTYTIFAHQFSASQDLTTVVDVVYRSNVNASWESLYAEGTYPTLDQTVRIEDDVSPSLEEVLAGHYSNFERVATWTPIAASSTAGAAIAGQTLPSGRPTLAPVDAALTEQSLGDQAPDPEAMARLLQMLKEQHVDWGQGYPGTERPPGLPLSIGLLPPVPAPRLPGNRN